MKVYIANFGSGNRAWPECLRRSAIAVMDDMRVHPYWQRGDREGYIETAMRVLRTMKGVPPSRNTASYWYNVTTILHETSGDLWLHRDKDRLWWTVSTAEPPGPPEIVDDPAYTHSAPKIAVYYKQCEGWSNQDKMGRPLLWKEIHPSAGDFLSSDGKGTFQQLRGDHPAFAQALLEGADLSSWYNLPEWKDKARKTGWTPVRRFTPAEIAQKQQEQRMQQTAARMIKTARQTALQSGQELISVTKDKRFDFSSDAAALEYALEMMNQQKGLCALTGLQMLLDEEPGDNQLRYSLDRIDSSKHYETGNLQVVCKFVNQWKGAMANEEFQRLLALARA